MSGKLRLAFPVAAGIVPIEVVAVIAGVVIAAHVYPLFANDTLSIPHTFVQIEPANLCQVLHGGGDAAEAVGHLMPGAVDVYQGL